MNEQQLHDVFWAASCFSGACLLLVFAVSGTRHGRRRVDVRWIATVAAIWGGGSFSVSAYAARAGTGWGTEVIAGLLASAPVIFTIAYVCAMQARRYRGARDRPRLRRWFSKAYFILFAALLVSAALQAMHPYQHIANNYAPAPFRAMIFEAPILVSQFSFALAAAFVFYEAAATELPGVRVNIQNASAAVLMTSFAVETILGYGVLTVRTTGSAAEIDFWVSRLLRIFDTLIVLELLSVIIAVGAYYSRSAVSKVSGKLLDCFDRGRQIEGALGNVPVQKWGISGPYEYLKQAAREEGLKLTEAEKQKADDGYRLAVLWHRNGLTHEDGRRIISAEEFVDLLKVYEEDLSDPDISERTPVQRTVDSYALHEVYEVIEPMLTRNPRQAPLNFMVAQRWAQLVYVAVADAGFLLPKRTAEIVVLPQVRRAYELNKRKMWYEATS